MVRPKKYLGQHFLTDQRVAQKIVDALVSPEDGGISVIEIGPGTGVLTRYLVEKKGVDPWLIEIDEESVAHLQQHHHLGDRIIHGDFLELDLSQIGRPRLAIIGNFPYNISSQIFFRILDMRDRVTEVVCMLQKEVADRIASPHGNKTYGILSVLLQAYFDIRFLFKVPPGVFFPPPKVMSAVIRLERNQRQQLPCDEKLFVRVVKQGFQNRRKTLRNALKALNLPAFDPSNPKSLSKLPVMDKRAEQLSVDDFIELTTLIEQAHEGSR